MAPGTSKLSSTQTKHEKKQSEKQNWNSFPKILIRNSSYLKSEIGCVENHKTPEEIEFIRFHNPGVMTLYRYLINADAKLPSSVETNQCAPSGLAGDSFPDGKYNLIKFNEMNTLGRNWGIMTKGIMVLKF